MNNKQKAEKNVCTQTQHIKKRGGHPTLMLPSRSRVPHKRVPWRRLPVPIRRAIPIYVLTTASDRKITTK